MKKYTFLLLTLVMLVLVGCSKDNSSNEDMFDKQAKCIEIGESYIKNSDVGFYGYLEDLNTCIGATIKQYDTNIDYDIYDILGKKTLYTCTYYTSSDPGTNNCNAEFFNLIDNKYNLR